MGKHRNMWHCICTRLFPDKIKKQNYKTSPDTYYRHGGIGWIPYLRALTISQLKTKSQNSKLTTQNQSLTTQKQ